jgi:hypothetical protein
MCLSIPYQLLNQLVDIYEIQYEGHAIEVDHNAISNPVASTITK